MAVAVSPEMPPESILAAGLVVGQGVALVDAGDDALEDALRRALDRSTIWEPANVADPTDQFDALGRGLPRWEEPADLSPELAGRLAELWSTCVPPPRVEWVQRFVRISVESAIDAERLRTLTPQGLVVVPSLRHGFGSFRWRWPLRVGVVDGPRAAEWLSVVTSANHHGVVFDAELVRVGSDPVDDFYEIVILDAAALPGPAEPIAAPVREATCVIVTGATDAVGMLGPTIDGFHPVIAAAIPGSPHQWWGPLYEDLSHDLPIDVAVAHADPAALIVLPEIGADVTAVAHWFVAASLESPELGGAAAMVTWDFMHESGGATEISSRARSLSAGGRVPRVELHLETAAANGGDDEAAESDAASAVDGDAAPAAASKRRLVAEFWHGESKLRKVLPPVTELQLEVKIAIPRQGEAAAEVAFPEPDHAGPEAPLDVVVTSSLWPKPQIQQISLPMDPSQRDQPSGSALFTFTTPAAGGVATFDIVVRYRNHPLQAATLTASVRDKSIPSDRPRLLTHALSGPNEPTTTAVPIDASLDARGAELSDDSGNAVLITAVQDMLDAFEDMISKVLGVVDAPESFGDERALRLLIELARKGSELRTLLQDFGLDEARSINLLVSTSTRVLPLELVYEATAPQHGAKLCRHVKDPPPPGEPCTLASARVVCPYAFWGLHRAVSRTVASTGRVRAGAVTTIVPSPVLYAATVIADEGAADPMPSARLEQAAAELFGSVTRVTSWTKWRHAVKKERPSLLVVLGHTQTERGEVALHIGKNSALARPDITSTVLRRADAPPPLVVLMACATAAVGDPFGTLPGVLTAKGAGAVVGTLSKINGPQGASAAGSVLAALRDASMTGASLGDALTKARQALVAQGLLLGLILVSHGEIDTVVSA